MSRTRAIAGILAGLVVGAALTVQPGAAPCRQLSDETLKSAHRGVTGVVPLNWAAGPEELQEFKQLWARTDCGTVQVPLNYREPRGRQITVAVTRLRATFRRAGWGDS
jgi:hypothetical protein